MVIDTSTRSARVKDHLLDYMDNNRLGPGEQLPSEAEMAKTLGVSRNTIREAYITLEAEGFIIRKHGIGTFVARPSKVKESLIDGLMGFPQRITSSGYTHDYEIICRGHVIPSAEISNILQTKPNEKVLQFKYIQYAGSAPAIFLVDHFSHLIDQAQINWDRFNGDMLRFISEELDMPERHFYSRILAALVDEEIAAHLRLPIGLPIVNIRSTITSLQGQPVTHSNVYLNPENIEFDVARIYRYQ